MKRVKIEVLGCKNPLFEEWILAWKVAAAEQGSEMQYTFGKALRSLQKYPFKLQSGKECIILESFGKKICEMLDKKLEDYRKTLSEDEWAKLISSNAVTVDNPSPLKSAKVLNNDTEAQSQGKRVSVSPDNSKKKKKKTSTSDGSYVPKYRSGGYALLLALFNSSQGKDGLTKSSLIKEAQEFCDTSFSKSQPGSFYTAWSSMATLVKKNLVVKDGKPVKFKLTEEGFTLAKSLSTLTAEELNLFNTPTPNKKVSANVVKPRKPIPCNIMLDVPLSIDQDLNFGTNCDTSQSQRSFSLSQDENSNGLNPRLPSLSSDYQSSSTSIISKYSSNTNSHESKEAKRKDLPPNLDIYDSQKDTFSCERQDLYPACYPSQNETESHLSQAQSQSSNSEEPHETVFMFPGTFQIILLLDIHETAGMGRTDATQLGLQRRGVLFESRHLTVGDFAWIARDKTGIELTLPYIVERKRMDDMASSIKDGRFHEQKFRLKGSGVKNVIYLIEKYGKDSKRLGLPQQTLDQAGINTQVIDGFTVKISKDHDDSMRYLSCFTKLLTQHFKDKTLMSCPMKNLPDFDLNSDLQSLMTFKQFNKDSTKNKVFTVKDMLVKQLIQLKGMSVEKATTITDRYPTPRDLISALQREGDKIIADLSYCPLRRLGPSLARQIHQLYTLSELQ